STVMLAVEPSSAARLVSTDSMALSAPDVSTVTDAAISSPESTAPSAPAMPPPTNPAAPPQSNSTGTVIGSGSGSGGRSPGHWTSTGMAGNWRLAGSAMT